MARPYIEHQYIPEHKTDDPYIILRAVTEGLSNDHIIKPQEAILPIPEVPTLRESLVTSFQEAAVSTAGIVRAVFVPRGETEGNKRVQRLEQRRDTLQHRLSSVRYAGEHIYDPGPNRSGPYRRRTDIRKDLKGGWIGTHTQDITERRNPALYHGPTEDNGNPVDPNERPYGYTGTKHKSRPHIYRPITLSERRTVGRLEKRREKISLKLAAAEQLKRVYGEASSTDYASLTGRDERLYAKNHRKITRLQRQAKWHINRFDKVTGSNDLRGKFATKRLERIVGVGAADNKSRRAGSFERVQTRQEHWREAAELAKRGTKATGRGLRKAGAYSSKKVLSGTKQTYGRLRQSDARTMNYIRNKREARRQRRDNS